MAELCFFLFFSSLSLSLPLSFSLFPWKKKIYISNNLSKLKDKSGSSVLGNVWARPVQRGPRSPCLPRGRGQSPGSAGRRPGATTHLGGPVQPLVDGSLHQEEAGRWAERWEGRAPGRTSGGSLDLYKGPLPGRAGALRRGASVQTRGPLSSSPGKEDSAWVASPDSRARREAHGWRRGRGPDLPLPRRGRGGGSRHPPTGFGESTPCRATNRERAEGAEGNCRNASSRSEVDDGVSGFLPRSARSLRITHAGGGGKRERGGKGAGRAGPRARGRSGPRAPCGPREPPGARPGRRGCW